MVRIPSTEQRRRGPYRKFDRFIGRREAELFVLFGHFLPDGSVARSRRFQHLFFAKALSDMARDATKYAALVAVVASTGSAFQSSLMTVATLVPVAVFGLYAGEVADSLPKRVAIAASYAVAGVACFLIPTALGTDVPAMFALVFVVAAVSQLAAPAENSAIPLVATQEQFASATSLMGLASGVGTAVGTAFLAPVLLKVIGPRAVFYVAGVLLFAAATRVLHVYSKRDQGRGGPLPRPTLATNRSALTWLFQHRAVATMVGVSVLAGVSNVILATLAPVYVRDVLEGDPADTVYVMAPAGIAMTASLWFAPLAIRLLGERRTAVAGLFLAVVGLVTLGLVQADIGALIDRINPLRAASTVGLPMGEQYRSVAAICVVIGFGLGLTDNSVKTYINRRVPFAYQGRTFAVRNTLESAIAIVPLLLAAAVASAVGVSAVLVATPLTIYLVILILLRLSAHLGGEALSPSAVVARSFWDAADVPTTVQG